MSDEHDEGVYWQNDEPIHEDDILLSPKDWAQLITESYRDGKWMGRWQGCCVGLILGIVTATLCLRWFIWHLTGF